MIRLGIYGSQNDRFSILTNRTSEYYTESFVDNTLYMTRSSDTKCPEYLEIELSPDVNRDNFKNICDSINLDMEIGQNKLLSIPLKFMMHLKPYEICDNKFYITIPFNMFYDDIQLICFQFISVIFKLTGAGNNFLSCNLISKAIYYQNHLRRQMVHNRYENLVQCLSSAKINIMNPTDNIKYKIPFNGINKGFFIESQNVDEINHIKLSLHGNIVVEYNRFLVRSKCVKISQNLLYFPFNVNKLYMDRTREGYEDSINFSVIHLSELHLNFDSPQSTLCIYSLSANLFIIEDVRCSLAFTSDDLNNHVSEQYAPSTMSTLLNNVIVARSLSDNIRLTLSDRITNLIYRKITDSNKLLCGITHENIENNSHYMNCMQCDNNFSENEIKRWFHQRINCPMCRCDWTDFNIYINGEEIPIN